jgi:hypothetical protein
MSENVGDGAAAHAYYPGGYVQAGDVWINPTYWNDDGGGIPRGSFDYLVLLHEIGHALGLKHSFEDAPIISAQYDSYKYTVMSYTAWTGSGQQLRQLLSYDADVSRHPRDPVALRRQDISDRQ